MSILEIVLYSLLGAGFITWLILTIISSKKKKDKEDNEEEN